MVRSLNEKNRIKKMMKAKSEHEKVLEEREKGSNTTSHFHLIDLQGFSTHFAGANTTTTKPTTAVKPTVRGPSFKSLKPKSDGLVTFLLTHDLIDAS
jgi:hypothetical protein